MIRHVLLEQATRVCDLPLLVDVVILHGLSQSVLVCLNQTTYRSDVELVWVCGSVKVVWQRYWLTSTL